MCRKGEVEVMGYRGKRREGKGREGKGVGEVK